jgi:hypothetical protein
MMKLRVLEGSFVNVKGGKGNNVESDLHQEHAVRNQKILIKQLGAIFEQARFVAMSDTLTKDQVKTLPEKLGLKSPKLISITPDRPNTPDPKGHVIYCHHLASVVVVRPSSVVNFFKNLLL